MAKDPLPPLHPWWYVAIMRVWMYVTWPRTVRELRQAGFRRTGWMTWETGPAEEGR